MTSSRRTEVDPATRRRVIIASLLRSGASTVLLLVLYYLFPLDRPLDAATWVELGLGLVCFVAVTVWQVRSIVGSATPRLRAVQVVAVGLPLLLMLFASTYLLIAHAVAGSFSEPLNHTDSLYFTVTVFATVGFGDIVAKTELARIIVTIQMIVGLVAVGLVAKVVLGAVQIAVSRQGATGDPARRSPEDP
jgi:voltage-gated potassium channel